MDLRYMMIKDRYRFVYRPQVVLYNLEDNIRREREISLYLKELALYKISFKSLTQNRPDFKVKNELLNIAYACLENDLIFNHFRGARKLPLKLVSEFTYKSRAFIEKWQFYISAYILLLSGDNYKHLISYLSIEYNDKEKTSKAKALVTANDASFKNNMFMGVLLKCIKNAVIILTPFGDFVKIRPKENSLLQSGGICTGTLKRDFNFYKYPLITILFFILLLITASAFMYLKPFRTVLIQANSTIKLDVNFLNKVVKVTPLSTYGNRITQSLDLFNVSTDRSITTILKKAKDENIIKPDTKVSIFITGSKKLQLSLPETEAFINESGLKVQINNNGVEYKIQNNTSQIGK